MPGHSRYSVRIRPYTSTPVLVEAPALSQRLVAAMDAADLGTRPLAELTGVNKETISSWRTGRVTHVHVATVRRIAAPLNTTAEDLLDLPTTSAQRPDPPPPRLLPDIDRVQALVDELAGVIARAKEGAQ